MDMGKRIKQLRIANDMTQEELGKYLGVQKSAIRKYEKGEIQNIKRSSIETMSNLFGVSPSYLMCLDEDSNNTNPKFSNDFLYNYTKLNNSGQEKILDYAKDLVEIPKYVKKNKNDNTK